MALWSRQHKAVNPDMVILGREAHGLTQKMLAEELGVTQGRVSKIEARLLPVPDDLLEDLSQVLDYPPHFFQQEGTVHGIGIAEVFHRKRRDTPKKTLNMVYAQIEIRIRHVSTLLRSVDIPCAIPRLDVDEYNGQVEEIARLTRASLNVPKGPIEDLTQTLEDAGVVIVPFDFETRDIDAICRWVPGLPPLMFVNEASPKDRYRLSVAHELGHLVMHTYPGSEIEDQAFRFAAEFLMPEREIEVDLQETSLPHLTNLKRYWKVSMAALLMRAEQLHAIQPNRARYLWSQMSKAGYKTREPVELDVGGEEPSLLHELVETHRTELSYSIAELAEVLALNEDELRTQYLQERSRSTLRLIQ